MYCSVYLKGGKGKGGVLRYKVKYVFHCGSQSNSFEGH